VYRIWARALLPQKPETAPCQTAHHHTTRLRVDWARRGIPPAGLASVFGGQPPFTPLAMQHGLQSQVPFMLTAI